MVITLKTLIKINSAVNQSLFFVYHLQPFHLCIAGGNHITGTCKADTIVREIRVPVERIKLVSAEGGWLSKVPWIILGLLFIATLWKIGTRDAGRGTKS